MTTVVVTKKSGIACIAADTLATYGDMQESAELIANSDKLVRIGDAWVAPTGPASAQLVLKHFISTYEELPRLEDIDGIFDFLNVLQRALRDEYFVQGEGGLHRRLRVHADGAAHRLTRGPVRRLSPALGPGVHALLRVRIGAEYAMGAMDAAWETAVSAEELARIGVETAARFDVGTGLPLTLRTIPLEERAAEAGLFAEQIAPRRPPGSTSPAASPAATTPTSAEEATGP